MIHDIEWCIPSTARLLEMKRITILAFLIGLAAVTALIVWQGAAEITGTLAKLGFGIIFMLLSFALYLVIGAFALRFLFPVEKIPGLVPIFNSLWIGGSVNTLFPVAQLGGEAVKARVLNYYGAPGAIAASAALADTTVSALSLALWGFVGVAALFHLNVEANVTYGVAAGVTLFSIGSIIFFVLQRIGAVGYLAKSISGISSSKGWGLVIDNVKDVDTAVRNVYRNTPRLSLSVAIKLLARLAMSLEIWVAAYWMGHPISLIEAFMFRSLIATVRGAAFFIPQGLGVQEAAFIGLGGLVGISPGIALSISLATRAREVIESIAGFLLWQRLEGKSLWALISRDKSSS